MYVLSIRNNHHQDVCKNLSTVILATESPELLSAASTLYIAGGANSFGFDFQQPWNPTTKKVVFTMSCQSS